MPRVRASLLALFCWSAPTKRASVLTNFFWCACAVEFLKFLKTLDKGDDALLVCLLERYVYRAHGERTQQLAQPFYAEDEGNKVPHVIFPKNLRRIATGYSELLRLRGHSYNIFEFAFLNTRMLNDDAGRMEAIGYLVTSVFTAILQFAVFGILCYYSIGPDYESFMGRYGEMLADREGKQAIIVIAIGTTLLFCKRAYMQFSEAQEFNQVFTRLQMQPSPEMLRQGYLKFIGPKTIWCKRGCLWINTAVNCFLAGLVPVFNLYYLLLSESIDDAVLNSLALLFILELDEVVLPAWDDDRIEDELASNMLVYIGEKPKNTHEVVVVKVPAHALPHVTRARPSEPCTPRPKS